MTNCVKRNYMFNEKPKVSVIIPTYNRANLISRAIQSVLNQTYQDFEIIVVDDASRDDTKIVVNNFNDDRIIYIRHEINKGGGASRNTGIKMAQGDYIGLLDDDDEWLPEKLEKQVIKFQDSSEEVGLIYSGFYYILEKNDTVMYEVYPTLSGNVYVELLKGCILGSPTPLIKKSSFEKAGFFDEELPGCQDWDMWIRISKYYEFDYVPEILAKHRVHGKQISVNLDSKVFARKRLIKKYLSDLSKYPPILSMNLKRLGILCCLDNNQVEGRKYFCESIKQDSFQKSGYIHFMGSLLVPQIYKKILIKYCVTHIDEIVFYY